MGNFIPYSTNTKLVFRYDYWSKTFDASSYNPMLTGNRMSFQEVTQTLANIQDIQRPFTAKMRTAMWIYLSLIVLCLVVYLIVLNSTYSTDTIFIAVMVYFAVVFILAIAYYSYFRNLREKGQSQVQRAIDHHNQVAMAKGLRWSIPLQFPRWIELNIEFVQQGVYVPPVNQNQPYPNHGNGLAADGHPQQYPQNYYGGNQPAFNPQQGDYNLQQVGFNPQQGGYNPQQGGYNPQQGGYNPQPQPRGYNRQQDEV